METGKTSKYIKYAIGEIILVVIGILIALQINNWNEEQKIKKREGLTIFQLYGESIQIVNGIENNMAIMQDYIEASKLTIKDLQNGKITNGDTAQFAKGVVGVTFYPALQVPRNVYDEINNAGYLMEIQSEEVRSAIAEYYATLNWIESQLDYFRDVTLASGKIYREGFYSEFDETAPLMRNYDVDFEILKSDKEFRSILSRGVRNLVVFQENRQLLLNSANDMHDALEKALKL